MSKLKVLIIKTSSLGDIIHTFVAVNDLLINRLDIQIDWLVEESFADIIKLQPKIKKIHYYSLRKWRKKPLTLISELKKLKQIFIQEDYDIVIDAQGLIKTALIKYLLPPKAKLNFYGYDNKSIKEPLAIKFYSHRIKVSKQQHAIIRTRQLFAKIFAYAITEKFSSGLKIKPNNYFNNQKQEYVIFCHGSSWSSKFWYNRYWQRLAQLLAKKRIKVLLPWGNDLEKKQAETIVQFSSNCFILPKIKLFDLARIFKAAKMVIAVDTGLAHLSSILDIPTIAIYGSTNSTLTGVGGLFTNNLQSNYKCSPCLKRICPINSEQPPCYAEITPDKIFKIISTELQK